MIDCTIKLWIFFLGVPGGAGQGGFGGVPGGAGQGGFGGVPGGAGQGGFGGVPAGAGVKPPKYGTITHLYP